MRGELLQKLKKKLLKEKELIEKELNSFAQKKSEEDWQTILPKTGGESGSALDEIFADEIEEYLTSLSLEEILEKKLKHINLALEKIKNGKYGICEKCEKEIEEERLEILPEARFCAQCKKYSK